MSLTTIGPFVTMEAGVLMMPLVPGITATRASIEKTLRAIADAGVTSVGSCVARLDPGVKEYFIAFLQREYPSLVEGYGRLYAGSRADPAYAKQVKAMVGALSAGLLTPRGPAASP